VKSLREAFQYAVIRSCPQRYSVKCVQPDCQWNVYTHKVKDGNTFIGKKLCGIFWKACKAYTMKDFDKAIFELHGHRPTAVTKLKEEEAPENELSDWVVAKVYEKMLKSANWIVRPIDHLKLFQVINKRKSTQRHKTVHKNSLFQTQTSDEHLSEAARIDEERLRNGRVYIDWDDVQAIQEPVTTEGMEVKDWQAVQRRLD
nr:transposase, MuDR, MULE transposase domain protein [Tanacetum cinerariifolium]